MTEEYDMLKLENQLCFPLYACSKQVIRRYAPFLKKIDLTYTQYITMMVLWETDSIPVNELGERLYLDSGTLTPLLKKLEAKGLVLRKRDEIDERRVIVSLTQAGRDLKGPAREVPLKMGQCVDITGEEAAELIQLLNKLMSNVKASE